MKSYLDSMCNLDNLEPKEILGNGTFGIVYKCYSRILQKNVALKKIFWNSSPLLIYNEIESLMNFTHNNCRNIPKLINLHRYKDMIFIEMEYHHHQSIHTYLYRMNNDDIIHYMKDLLTALCDIHALGYIHCDIKPGNFLFDINTQTGFLCDFGLCTKTKRNNQKLKLLPKNPINNKALNNTSIENDEKYVKSNKLQFNFDYLERDIKVNKYSTDNNNIIQEKHEVRNQNSRGCTTHLEILLSNNDTSKQIRSKKEIQEIKYCEIINKKSRENDQENSSYNEYNYDSNNSSEETDLRDTMNARRAGTKGYRAPEVLWRMEDQTSAIDIWSAGIVFLSLLTKRLPFLSGKDDLTNLYEISCIVGRSKIQFEALMCGRFLALPDNGQEYFPFKELVEKLNPFIGDMNVPDSAFDLLEKMLEPSPRKRITANKCLQHPYFTCIDQKNK